MKLFAISDLHLSSVNPKPMDIFGDGWQNHFEKISKDWLDKVADGDVVALGGDMSWGIDIDEAAPDFSLVAALPGKKVVIKGNHDYYWNSLSKMKLSFPAFDFVQNNCVRYDDILIAGTRGWTIKGCADFTTEDEKIYARELIRLKLSLDDMQTQRKDGDKVVALLHFPPFDAQYSGSEITQMLENYKVDKVLYGHLHGKNARVTPRFTKNGIEYILTSCDLIDNKLVEVY